MNPYLELPNLGSGLPSAHRGQAEQPDRQIDGLLSIGILRLVNGLESALQRFTGALSHWHRRRIAIRELQRLNAHHLADIGLERNQIISTVEQMLEEKTRTGSR